MSFPYVMHYQPAYRMSQRSVTRKGSHLKDAVGVVEGVVAAVVGVVVEEVVAEEAGVDVHVWMTEFS